jgi:hypothetical protein
MSVAQAKALLAEASQLHDVGLRKEQSWSVLKGPITERVKKAVQLAPNDPDVLFMATLILRHLGAGFPDLKKLNTEYQARLDQLGGPSDEILEIAGVSRGAYKRHSSSVKQAGSGCVVGVLGSLSMLAAAIAIAAGGR